MNYTKKGIHEKQKSLHATSTRLLKKGLLAVLNLFLIAVLACGIIGASLGIGIFKGVIDTAPSIENVKVTPTGFSTFVYDLEGNQIAKLISRRFQPYSGHLGYDTGKSGTRFRCNRG